MAFGIAPVDGFPGAPAAAFPQIPVGTINFVGSKFTCTRGAGEHSNVITVEMRPPPVDPFFADVLLLLSGTAGALVDSSTYHRTITHGAENTGPPATYGFAAPLFGNPTYQLTSQVVQYVSVPDDWLGPGIGASEWCYEVFINVTQIVSAFNPTPTFTSIGRLTGQVNQDQSITMNMLNINNSVYSISSDPSSFSFGAWHHIAFVRDNSGAIFDYLKLYIDGIQAAQSSPITKGSLVGGSGFGQRAAIGSYSSPMVAALIEERFTWKHARYYTSFTPPTAPFPIPP